ncbi:MAG TPA: metalloregulator ArsR/SmtB family transcription factor [Bryobacteraceae bacterium]|nr:metalloregulator ArsR/SmtB family transcription factor [Bryobacteraceae bacterium]
MPPKPSILKTLRAAADPIRLRILLLLQREELSVAEVQEIIGKGQSHVSTSLAQLKQAGLVQDRRTGKNAFYRLNGTGSLGPLLEEAAAELPEAERDRQALDLVIRKRQDRMRRYFDELAGKFGRQYVPGRSWKGLAEALLKLMPRMVIADLGAGEGTISQLMAQRAEKVIAIDNSEKMVEFGADLARRNGIANLEYRLGDIEAVPIDDATVDLAFLSQALHHAPHPERALAEAWRILKPGGRVAILDLVQHGFEEAREMYADLWLGFSEMDIRRYLESAGFQNIDTTVVNREPDPPHFETILATAEKPAS